MQFLEEKTRQRLAEEAEPASNADILFATPPASEYNGIEFLEFAVDDNLGAKLSHWLERLGFVKAGQHRSKNVSRSEEHTSELQSLMRISYAVFCLKKKQYKKP